MAGTIKQEILRRALALVGAEELSRSLRVPVPLIHEWECGDCLMPDMAFLDLVDLLDERTAARSSQEANVPVVGVLSPDMAAG